MDIVLRKPGASLPPSTRKNHTHRVHDCGFAGIVRANEHRRLA
jgi:hypothetical protein